MLYLSHVRKGKITKRPLRREEINTWPVVLSVTWDMCVLIRGPLNFVANLYFQKREITSKMVCDIEE